MRGERGEDGCLLCDAVHVDAELIAVWVRVQVVSAEDDVRVDGGDETGGGNDGSHLCGLECAEGCQFLSGRKGGREEGSTDVLRKIRPGCDRA